MADSAYDFWNRIDELRGTETLKDICEKTGIKYSRVRNNRSDVRFLKSQDMQIFADYLHTTPAYLMFGDPPQDKSSTNTRADAIMEKLRTASDMELEMVERILGIGK